MSITFTKKKRKPRNRPVDVFKRIDMQGGDKEKCWEWQGVLRVGKNGEERAVISIAGKEQYVHRVVWELYNGRELGTREDGKPEVVRHRCDNTKCCNPYHLIVGSQKDNIMDQSRRERIGHKHADVKKVMQMLEIGCTSAYINEYLQREREVYMDDSTVRRIKRREFYRHIPWEWGDKWALSKGYLLESDFINGILKEQINTDNVEKRYNADASKDQQDT